MLEERLQTDDFLLGIWKAEESSKELLSMLEKKDLYLPFLESCTKEHRRKEWLATRILLKELLGEEWPIDHYPDGAPFLSGMPWQISISHTREYVAILLSQIHSVGIDIEYRSERVLKIRSRFMHPEEEVHIDPKQETDHLLVHWCAKETLFKIMGEKNIEFREQLHIHSFSCHSEGEFTAHETRTTHTHSYQINYRITPDYVLTYCIDKN